MFLNFFYNLKHSKIPVSLREFLTFLEVLETGLSDFDIDKFYYLARLSLIKDEKNIDKFDKVFSSTFSGIENTSLEALLESEQIPNDWIRKLADKILSKEEKDKIEALGGFEKLMQTLKQRLEEQKKTTSRWK